MNTRTVIKAMVAFFILVAIFYRINEQQVVNRDQVKLIQLLKVENVEVYKELDRMNKSFTKAMDELDSVIQSMQKQQTEHENHITELKNENTKLKQEVERLGK